ncbi:MAG: glycosyltransferase family 4 protein, partial [Nitrospinales bacterium]
SHFPDRIITSGTAISDMMNKVSGVSPEQVVSIVAGVDMKRFDHRISGEPVRKEFGLKPGQPLIGKIAVIRDWKGHDYFLEAVPLILKKFPEARFVIVGSGVQEETVRQKINNLGLGHCVIMTGHREDIPKILAALDVFVLASYAGEATSQVIPQAFAMKRPVVATRAGGIPEILDDNERGILADIRSAESLAEGIMRLLENPDLAERFVENAFQFCRNELTVEQMIDKTVAVYESLLNSSNPL